MPYFECSECGQMASISAFDQTARRDYCPNCETQTTWTVAFADESGVSF